MVSRFTNRVTDRLYSMTQNTPLFPAAARLRLMSQLRAAGGGGAEGELLLVRHLASLELASIDVGANWGNYTGEMLRWSKRVHAFEVNPEQAQMLKAGWPKAIVHGVGLGDQEGSAELTVPVLASGMALTGHGRIGEQIDMPGGTRILRIPVAIKTLDSMDMPPTGLIKIDVEGLEIAVVEGARQLITRDRPNMIIESQDSHAPGCPQALIALMESLDYSAWFCRKGTLHPFSDWNPEMRTGYGSVVNNFIFLPRERPTPKGMILA